MKFVATIIFLGAIMETLHGQPGREEGRRWPNELQGGAYRPKQVTDPGDLADWEGLHELPSFAGGSQKILKVRVYGFRKVNEGRPLDLLLEDPIILKTCEDAMYYISRPRVSDVGEVRAGVGAGSHLGVIQFQTENREFIIGVSQVGFFLGTAHGNFRQVFYSWALAKQIDDILRNATGTGIGKDDFDVLSGLGVLQANFRVYYSNRGQDGRAGP